MVVRGGVGPAGEEVEAGMLCGTDTCTMAAAYCCALVLAACDLVDLWRASEHATN